MLHVRLFSCLPSAEVLCCEACVVGGGVRCCTVCPGVVLGGVSWCHVVFVCCEDEPRECYHPFFSEGSA